MPPRIPTGFQALPTSSGESLSARRPGEVRRSFLRMRCLALVARQPRLRRRSSIPIAKSRWSSLLRSRDRKPRLGHWRAHSHCGFVVSRRPCLLLPTRMATCRTAWRDSWVRRCYGPEKSTSSFPESPLAATNAVVIARSGSPSAMKRTRHTPSFDSRPRFCPVPSKRLYQRPGPTEARVSLKARVWMRRRFGYGVSSRTANPLRSSSSRHSAMTQRLVVRTPSSRRL